MYTKTTCLLYPLYRGACRGGRVGPATTVVLRSRASLTPELTTEPLTRLPVRVVGDEIVLHFS